MSDKRLTKAKRLRTRWAKALLSGMFKQDTDMLMDPKTGGFCCLGVYCEIRKPGAGPYYPTLAENSSHLSDASLLDLGISRSDENELIRLNDDHNIPFEVIADLILRIPYTFEECYCRDCQYDRV